MPSTLGPYRLLRELGRGGMGVVYEAEQMPLGRRVALKVFSVKTDLDQRRLERFRREAHATAVLDHPHIVPVYEVGEERGLHYYSMKYVPGQGLDRCPSPSAAATSRRWRTATSTGTGRLT